HYFHPVAIQTNLKHSNRSTLQDSLQHRSFPVKLTVLLVGCSFSQGRNKNLEENK
ncbi:hypothetical protein P692DRAFT_20718242, partial [Suillus brevipes Sb2]